MVNSTGQMTWFLQQANCRERNSVEGEVTDLRDMLTNPSV